MWRGVFVILFSLGTVLSEENLKVATKLGYYEGISTTIQRGQRVASYLGISYAKPPIGELRFKKPARLERPWRGTRYRTEYRQPCLSFEGSTEGNEDCLYLNVFTKQVEQNSSEKKNSTKSPVIVFLISDSFGKNNNSFYTPEYLLVHDVVLVTVNYRLGYFGFFTTGDEVAPGNYGLKDVLEALHWIHENIAAFGGDPDAVTLIGQGAGAGVVHLLALSEKSEGLFHKYVTQSGSAGMPWSYRPREKAKSTSLEFAASVNCTGDTNEEIVDCLRELPVSVNGDISTEIVTPWSSYGPTDEPESDEAVITQHPKILIREGKLLDIPWLTGVVADEGLLFNLDKFTNENSTICDELNKRFEEIIYTITDYRDSVNDSDEFINSLISFYFADKITENCTSYFIELVGDMSINWPIFNGMKTQSEKMESPVYFYNFAYNGTFTTTYNFNKDEKLGISHGDDVNYLFPVLNKVFYDLQQRNTELDIAMINIVTEMWTSFATTGIPEASLSPNWTSYNEEQSYMKFKPNAYLAIEQEFLKDRMDFWEEITDELFTDYEDPDENEAGNGSAISIRKNHPISESLLCFLAQFVILGIFNRI